jgi:hypothetical protein
MLNGARRIAPRMHLPLRRLALCLDCDECFEITDACPACGSETWTSLARFLEWGRLESLARIMGSAAMRTRHLIVVTRDRRALYERLRHVLAESPEFEVILDRRRAERRRATGSPARERRQRDRRAARAGADAALPSALIVDLGS